MNIVDFVNERKNKNHLNFSVDDCLLYIESYCNSHEDSTPIKSFFHYIKNLVNTKIGDLYNLDKLKIRGKKDITFYEFVDEDDYRQWLVKRIQIYEQIVKTSDLRLLNFLELSTMNFIADITSIQPYKIISKQHGISVINKTGYGTDQDTQSFIKYLGSNFKNEYSFRPF